MVRKFVIWGVTALVTIGGSTVAVAANAATKPTVYKNCTELQKVYKHGVGRKGATDVVRGSTVPVTTWVVNTVVYKANLARDRDKDGVACEKR